MSCMKYFRKWLLFCGFCVNALLGYTQTDSIPKMDKKSYGNSSKVSAIKKVESAKKGESWKEETAALEKLATQFEQEGNWQQANVYYQKAIDIYKLRKDASNASRLYRQIGYNEERLNNTKNAALNYEAAEKFAPSKADKIINSNDAQRVQSNSIVQSEALLEQNKAIAVKEQNTEEVSRIAQQQARMSVAKEDASTANQKVDAAVLSSKNAYETIALRGEIAQKFAEESLIDSAIDLTIRNSQDAYESQLWTAYFDLQLQLSQFYAQKQQPDSSLYVLHQALLLAQELHHTTSVLSIHQALRSYYMQHNRADLAYAISDTLLRNIIDIVKADSLLWDQELFSEIAQKVQLLESEKDAQQTLIAQTQSFNWVLLATLILLIGGLVYIFRMVLQLRKRNQKIALQSLRREMNPHFIFNSLNSVNQYIALNDPIAANQYLSSYSKLMRNVMSSAAKDFVKVKEEYGQLEQYIAIEALRFKEQFDYALTMDEGLEWYKMPNMIIQPFIENAVWHGLRYKTNKGLLTVHFKDTSATTFEVWITDNGIGMEASKNAKTKFQKTYESRGLQNIDERIHLLNQLYKLNIRYEVSIPEQHEGTQVVIYFPKQTPESIADED